MKAVVEFDSEEDMRTALDGHKWESLAYHFDELYLRSRIKYETMPEAQRRVLQEVRDHFHELMAERNLSST